MEDIGTAEKRLSVDFIGVEGNVGEKKHLAIFDIFEVLNFDLVGEEFIKGTVKYVLNEIFDGTEIGQSIHNFSKKSPEDHSYYLY